MGRRPFVVGGAILVVVAALASWWHMRRGERHGELPPPASAAGSHVSVTVPFELPDPTRLHPRTAEYGADMLGINEGVALPGTSLTVGRSSILDRPTLQRRAMQVRGLGATLVRAGSHTYPHLNWQEMTEDPERGWAWADDFFSVLGEADLDVIAVIGPWPGARTAVFTEQYVPEDLEAYGEWVEAVVERYDGDGHQDMPGLTRPVLAWEVDNEPDLHHAMPPRDPQGKPMEPGTFETPSEYAEVLLATSRAIRRADPDAFILSGGLYRPMTPKGVEYLREVLAVEGVTEAISGISLHCYLAQDDLDVIHLAMENFRELAPGKPIWITETSVPSMGQMPWMTPQWQAKMVVAIHGAMIAEGADRILWHTLVDPPTRQGPTGFRYNALYWTRRDGGMARREIKPAGEAYQRMAERLGPVELDRVRAVRSGDGLLLEAPEGWLVYWGTVDTPAGAAQAEDLTTGEIVPVGDTVTAPAWLMP